MLPLLGVLVVIVGFVLRLNPLLVVTTAGIVTGMAAGFSLHEIIESFGKAFIDNRFVATAWLVFPVIGLLERVGLKERAQELIGRIHVATTGRILIIYFAVRQLAAALGLVSLGGHAAMVRPIIAPMAEGAAEHRYGSITDALRERIRAHAAAVDNIALFFGEDVFIAIGSILLIKGVLEQQGILVEPLQVALWAIPTAIAAFIVHGARLILFDKKLDRDVTPAANTAGAETTV